MEDGASFSLVVDGDSEVRTRAVEVEVQLELRNPGEDAWELGTQTRFELTGPDRWPLHDETNQAPVRPGAKCQLGAIARDQRRAVVAQARTPVTSCERASADGLRVTLRFSEEDSPPDAAVPDEPDLPEEVAEECEGRKPNVSFCDGEVMRVCDATLSWAELRPCGEHERCVTVGEDVRCACRPGYVQSARGCEVPDCARFDGGCVP